MQTTTVQCASQAEAAGRSQGYSPSSDTSRAQSQLVVLAVVGVIAAICMAALIVSFVLQRCALTFELHIPESVFVLVLLPSHVYSPCCPQALLPIAMCSPGNKTPGVELAAENKSMHRRWSRRHGHRPVPTLGSSRISSTVTSFSVAAGAPADARTYQAPLMDGSTVSNSPHAPCDSTEAQALQDQLAGAPPGLRRIACPPYEARVTFSQQFSPADGSKSPSVASRTSLDTANSPGQRRHGHGFASPQSNDGFCTPHLFVPPPSQASLTPGCASTSVTPASTCIAAQPSMTPTASDESQALLASSVATKDVKPKTTETAQAGGPVEYYASTLTARSSSIPVSTESSGTTSDMAGAGSHEFSEVQSLASLQLDAPESNSGSFCGQEGLLRMPPMMCEMLAAKDAAVPSKLESELSECPPKRSISRHGAC